jgi:hypothetical protein
LELNLFDSCWFCWFCWLLLAVAGCCWLLLSLWFTPTTGSGQSAAAAAAAAAHGRQRGSKRSELMANAELCSKKMTAIDNESISIMGLPLKPFQQDPEYEGLLQLIMRWYAVVLISLFVVTSLVYSINTSKVEEGAVAPTIKGPGGKPLPVNKRKKQLQGSSDTCFGKNLCLPDVGPSAKRAFQLLSLILFFVFVVNGTAIGIHAWKANGDALIGEIVWWCGEPMVVSHHRPKPLCSLQLLTQI